MKIKLEEKLTELSNENLAKVTDENETNLASKLTSTDILSESGTDCMICADLILDYIPKYFNGIEINPACYKCQDPTSQDAISVLSTNQDSAFVLPTNQDSTFVLPTSHNAATFLDSKGIDNTILDTNSQDQNNVTIDFTSKSMNIPSFETTKDQLRTEVPRVARSLFPPYKCEVCEITIIWPRTVEQPFTWRCIERKELYF